MQFLSELVVILKTAKECLIKNNIVGNACTQILALFYEII